jgi:hypothetical protein
MLTLTPLDEKAQSMLTSDSPLRLRYNVIVAVNYASRSRIMIKKFQLQIKTRKRTKSLVQYR